MTRTKSTLLLTALLASGLAGIAGCDTGSPAASAGASAAPNRQQLLGLAQQWVQCLRDKGLTRMPDAELSQDGYLQFPPAGGYNWKADLSTHKDIIDACKSIEDSYPANAFRPKNQLSAEDMRKLAAYADCLRKHGIPAFPDPNANGEFDLSGTSLANGIPVAVHDQADAACHQIWTGPVRVTGGEGGKK